MKTSLLRSAAASLARTTAARVPLAAAARPRALAALTATATAFASSSYAFSNPAPQTPLDHEYPSPPARYDDPEYNAKVLQGWREHIGRARKLFTALDYAGAERELQLALEDAMHFGQSSGPVATSLLNLAQLYRRAGRSKEAEPLLVRAVDVLEQTAGPNNKVTLVALLDLAGTHVDLGKHKDAIAGFEDALSRLDIAEQNQQHGREALREVRAGCLFKLAKTLAAQGDLDGAEGKLRDSLALLEARWGETSSKLLAPCTELALVLHQRGEPEESRRFLERALSLDQLQPAQKERVEKLRLQLKL